MRHWRFLLPMLLSYFAAYWCPMGQDDGNHIKARPPAYVFGIVWPILYVLIGVVWTRLSVMGVKYVDQLFLGTSSMLALWIIFYSCYQQRVVAFYLINLVLGLAIFLVSYVTPIDFWSGLALLPYLTWMILATYLSGASTG